jgi:hypothetical protein
VHHTVTLSLDQLWKKKNPAEFFPVSSGGARDGKGAFGIFHFLILDR